jgi:hypothetical protein
VLAPDGDRLGAVDQIFLDEATDIPEWVLVRLDDADKKAFVPLAGASVEEHAIRLDHDRERIAAAPQLEVEDTLTVTECRRLYDHYGLAYSQEESPTVLPEGAAADSAAETSEGERTRLRRYESATESGDSTTGDADETTAAAGTDMPVTKGTGAVEPTPVPIASPPPRPIPPEGGFQAQQEDAGPLGGKLAILKRRPALPITLAGGIAALIGFLVLRKRR